MIATKKIFPPKRVPREKRPPSKGRLRLFQVLAAGLPLLLLALLEGALRLFGYGHDYRLFVEDARHRGYLVMNPHASGKYFTVPENATTGNAERFRPRKDAGTFRLFVLGESTTIGYPYLHNGSFHRWLHYRLLHALPEKNVEVINVSLTAVNSYTVLGFAREVARYQPDAVLIYAGHNEYYGALGVGSTSYLGRNPYLVRAVLRLRELRLVQLFGRAVAGVGSWFRADAADPRETLMRRMAARQQIPLGSDLYHSGIGQFETNLHDALRVFGARGIPVLVSTLVSNERDLKPLLGGAGEGPATAAGQFRLAGEAYRRGDFAAAKMYYVRAKELDLLRFRAPEAMNGVIRRLAAQYPHVELVDAQKLFEAHSPHGILGRETLLEHVHPNLYGYALLSEAFYGALRRRRLVDVPPDREMSFDGLRAQMPVTPVDSLKGAYEILMLKEGWPFNEPIPAGALPKGTFEEKLAGALAVKQLSWGEAMVQLQAHYLREKREADARRVAEALLLEYPYDPAHYNRAGKLCMNLGENERAAFYLKKAFDLENTPETARSLLVTLLKLDRPGEALPYLNASAAGTPNDASLAGLKTLVDQVIAAKAQYQRDTTDLARANRVAAAYLAFANTEAARRYLENVLRRAPGDAEAARLMARLEALEAGRTTQP